MKMLNYILLLAVTTAFIIAGCQTPYKTNVRFSAIPQNVQSCKKSRPCSIDLKIDFFDTINEKDSSVTKKQKNKNQMVGDKVGYNYMVPFILFNFYGKSGASFINSHKIDPEVKTNFKALVKDTLVKSNIINGKGKKYTLKINVLHFYGVNYSKRGGFIGAGAYMIEEFTFYPAGYVNLELLLIDNATKKVLGKRYISNAYLLNPKHPKLKYAKGHSAYSGISQSIDQQKIDVAVIALSRVMDELPTAIDQMLSQQRNLQLGYVNTNTFTLARMTKEYDYVELMTVNTRTGQILKKEIVKRNFPIVSKPNEWFVLPMADGHWLSKRKYKQLIRAVGRRYRLNTKDNLNVALFKG